MNLVPVLLLPTLSLPPLHWQWMVLIMVTVMAFHSHTPVSPGGGACEVGSYRQFNVDLSRSAGAVSQGHSPTAGSDTSTAADARLSQSDAWAVSIADSVTHTCAWYDSAYIYWQGLFMGLVSLGHRVRVLGIFYFSIGRRAGIMRPVLRQLLSDLLCFCLRNQRAYW